MDKSLCSPRRMHRVINRRFARIIEETDVIHGMHEAYFYSYSYTNQGEGAKRTNLVDK
ncbi:MAG: hypothetical protein FWE69_05020 [Clostridiales bacterium]|nr:hypothetical protein [Clostridiales bacterium]